MLDDPGLREHDAAVLHGAAEWKVILLYWYICIVLLYQFLPSLQPSVNLIRYPSWARERHIVETKLAHGIQSFGSARGVSGHQHNPFAGKFVF